MSDLIPLAVTTSFTPDPKTRAHATELASRLRLPFLTRGGASIPDLLQRKARALLVVMRDRTELHDAEGRFTWTPGMAQLRLKTIAQGGGDTLWEVAQLQPGETVLDATLGLANDALIAARAVGPKGRVVGLEKSRALFAVVSEGLARWTPDEDSCRVEPVQADAAEYLRQLPSHSVDVVLFDPMFARPRKAQPGFEMLRRHADETPLSLEVLNEARRVARRAVVVKGARYSDDLSKLGLNALPRSRYAEVIWARIDLSVTGAGGAGGALAADR